ncbi:MAG: glycosyltransferase [Geminocystis sp.]|nr:glycosyltransferase [Geminocystis sp.]MCS7148793.1 glycosyltransferase [Geminocystis sp.]MDW8115369.1 glycosyltransferase [Geminocystis sp.]MDW8462911.1 glycosyltransferase [Geminocystis sp.]
MAESLNLFNSIAFFFHTIFSIDRSPEADRLSQAVVQGKYLPWVDVIIPTYNEGVDILRRTVIGCQAMDYPHKKIYLLDDTRRPEVRALAAELGCEYRDRPDNRHAKAGNINHALPTLTGELIAVFDADFVPCRNFLTRTVGFFQDPKTALVQTPQHFFNEDPITVNLGLQGTVNNEQTLFFRFIQPSRDFFDAVVCCGTCFVIRRSALDEIGGIPTESITEDYFTSLRLQTLGYRVKYLNEALAAGLSPENISAYINQRLRWCQGTLQMLFLKGNFLTAPNLSLPQRFSHSLSIVYWLLSIPRVLFLLIPLAYLLFGLAPLKATVNEVIYFYLPYYIGNIMTFSWLTEGLRSAFWSDVYETVICLPMAATVINTLWRPKGKRFKVTPKGIIDPHKIHVNWFLVRPFLIIAILTIVGLIWRTSPLQDTIVNPDSLIINMMWSSYNLILMAMCILASIDVPQRRHTRFPRREYCQLFLDEYQYSGYTLDISEGGARIFLYPHCNYLPPHLPKGLKGQIHFTGLASELAGLTIDVELEWYRGGRNSPTGEVQVGLRFVNLSIPILRRLIPYLYCQPGQWDEVKAPEIKTAWAFFQSIFRLYPLTETR